MSSCSVKGCLLFLYLVIVVLIAVVVDVIQLYRCSSSACFGYEAEPSSGRNAVLSLNVEILEEMLRQRGVLLPASADFRAGHRPHVHPHSNHFVRVLSANDSYRHHRKDYGHSNHSVRPSTKGAEGRSLAYRETLADLVQRSGAVHVDELLDITASRWTTPPLLESSAADNGLVGKSLRSEADLKRLLLELNSNEAGSGLLILVRLRGGVTLLEKNSWRELVDTFGRFGVQAAVFECGADPESCERRNWLVPQLILALPKARVPPATEGQAAKAVDSSEVAWHSLYNVYKAHQVIGWVAKQLANGVHRVRSADLGSWTKFSESASGITEPKLRLLLVSARGQVPILLSSMALRFRDRIDVGIVNPDEVQLAHTALGGFLLDRSTYLVLTPGSGASNSCVVYTYGKDRGEAMSFRRLEIFLKFRLPEGRNVFTISLTLVNLLLCIELFIIEESCCAKHVISWLMRVGLYNAVFVAVWLTVVALLQCNFAWLDRLTDQAVIVLVQKYFCNSFVGHLLLAHWFFVSSLPLLAISVFLFGCAVAAFSWSWVRPVASQPTDVGSRVSPNQIDSSARPLLPEAPYLRHRTRLSWIERSNQHSVVLINQFLWPLQTTASQRLRQRYPGAPIDSQANLEEGLRYCQAATLDYINQLPRWRFEYDPAINGQVTELTEVHCSDEKYEALLLEYTKFPAGMIPSMVCSICLERYRGSVAVQNSKQGTAGSRRGWDEICRLNERQVEQVADTLCGLPCGHNFHAHCVKAWLARDEHASCPICRWPCYKQKDSPSRKSPDSCGDWDLGSPV